MKVLTLHQPWASLIALGVKTIETRSWSTQYRGPLAIHAGAKMPTFERRYVRGVVCIRDAWDLWTISGPNVHAPLPLGAILATCTLVDVVPMAGQPFDPSMAPDRHWLSVTEGMGLALMSGRNEVERFVDDQRPYGDFTPGRYAWLLGDIVPMDPPVPFKGGQGLTKTWEVA